MATPTVNISELQKFTELANESFNIVEKQYQSVEKLLKRDFSDFKAASLDQIEAIQKTLTTLQDDPTELGFQNLSSLLKNLFHFIADYSLGKRKPKEESEKKDTPKISRSSTVYGSAPESLSPNTAPSSTPTSSTPSKTVSSTSTENPSPQITPATPKKSECFEIPEFKGLIASNNSTVRSMTQSTGVLQHLSTTAQKQAPPRPPRTNVPVGSLSKQSPAQARAVVARSVMLTKAFGGPAPPHATTGAPSTTPTTQSQNPRVLVKKKSNSFHHDDLKQILADPILQKYALDGPKIVRCQLCIRSWLRRKRFRNTVRAFAETSEGKVAKQRLNVAKEIIETEKTYLSSVKLLVECFIIPLRKEKILPDEVVNEIFKNCESIVACNQFLMDGLNNEFADQRIGKLVLEIAPFFRIYTEYISSFDISNSKLQSLIKEHQSVAWFIKKCETEARAQANRTLDIVDLMIQPIQRIPRYALLLQELLRCTPAEHKDKPSLELALDLVKKLTEHINESKKQTERIRKIVEVQDRIQGNFLKLVEPHRMFIAEGDLIKMWDGTPEEHHFFLFNDVLVYCHTHTAVLSSKKTYKYVSFFLLNRALVVDVEQTDKDKFCFAITYPQKKQSFVLAAKTLAEKKQWMSDIDAQIKAMEKSTLIVKEAQENNDFLRGTTMRGFLTKQGDKVKNWKKRYFQLKGNSLFYYHNPEDTQPLGFIHLRDGETVNYTVKMATKILKKNCIQLYSPTNRKYYLTADSPEVLRPWIFALKEIIPVDPDVQAAFPYKDEVTRISM